MNRYIKYNKGYQKAIVCFAVTLATVIYIAAVGAALYMSPAADSFLGMNRTTATTTLFFMPIGTAVSLILGLNYWFVAEGRRIGWFGLLYCDEEEKSRLD